MAGKDIADEDMSKLSDEEREALGLDDGEDEALDEIAEGDDDENPDEDALEADDSDDSEEPDDGDEKDDSDAQEADDSKKADLSEFEDDDNDEKRFIPNLKADSIENYEERMTDFQTKRDELLAKLEDGDIELTDYVKQDRALEAQETDLKMQKLQNDNIIKQNMHQQAERWKWEQETFFEQEANKIYTEDSLLAAAFQHKVMELARIEAEKDSNKSGMWFLREADKAVRERFNIGSDKQPKEKEVKNRKPNLSDIPKTLNKLPSVENGEVSDSEFAYIDKMDGEAQERELARLSKVDPAKLERYLQA